MNEEPISPVSGIIIAVCTSDVKHVQKDDVGSAVLVEELGLEGDAHAGFAHRQVSLLADESIDKMRALGLEDLRPGAFGENLTTRGIGLIALQVGQRLCVGQEVVLEVSQIGKECVDRCTIYYKAGDCIMPREGIFARVIKGGRISNGDAIGVMET
jgi:MOSC domain-containing protein YiiM